MTNCVARLVLGSTLVVLAASSAAAQDTRRIGLTFAFPGAVGVQWDVTDKFSLRADTGFTRFRDELRTNIGDLIPRGFQGISIPDPTTTYTSQNVSIAVSAMWALHTREQLKIYVAPRIGVDLRSQTTEIEYDLSGVPPALLAVLQLPSLQDEFSDTDTVPEFGAMFGVSYRLAERFAVFAETGVAYSRGNLDSGREFRTKFSQFGLRSGIGGILYF